MMVQMGGMQEWAGKGSQDGGYQSRHIGDSLPCTTGASTALDSNYTPIKII